MIRLCQKDEFEQIYAIVNDGALAYKGVIPADCWAQLYMSRGQLQHELDAGVVFWGSEENGTLRGVMGLQAVRDVTLIRHAYVLTACQRRGIGAHLLSHLQALARTPILVGSWADALWAIKFYQKNGFQLVRQDQMQLLLKRYWTVPPRQMEVSVVLTNTTRRETNREG